MAKIDISNMPGNSNSSKKETAAENKPRAKAHKRKKRLANIGSAFFDMEDAPRIDITHNVLEPGVKNLALDIISSIADTIVDAFQLALFKDTRPRDRRRTRDDDRYRNGYIDYSSRSVRKGSEDSRRRRRNAFSRDVADFEDLSYLTFSDAQEALSKAKDILDGRNYVTIADLYHASKLRPRSPIDSEWGWTSLSSAYACRDSGDPEYPYTIVLPEPKDITHLIGR